MLLVEEYLGIELPDAEGLLPSLPSETVEMPEDDLEEDHLVMGGFDDDEDTDEQELLLRPSTDRRLQVALPVARPTPAAASAQIHSLRTPSRSRSSVSVGAPRIVAASRAFSATEAPDPLGTPEPRALRRYAFDDPSEIPEPLVAHGASPEPLRLALPTNAEEEASLVLAAAAPEDYDDEDWDEDDWDEDDELWDEDDDSLDDIPGASLRLTLDNDTMEDLRNLEERRSFAEPIWGPRPASDRFDSDISLFDESDEDDSAIFEREEIAKRAQADLVFDGPPSSSPPSREPSELEAFAFDDHYDEDDDDDESGAFPRVASVRIGIQPDPPGADAPEPLVQIAAPPAREIVRWDDDTTDGFGGQGAFVSPESDPVQSYSIVHDEETGGLAEKPLIEPEQPRRPRRPPPEEDERGSPLVWLVAISILIGVGGSAIYVLVKDLAWSPPPFSEFLPQPAPSTDITPDAAGPDAAGPDGAGPDGAGGPDDPGGNEAGAGADGAVPVVDGPQVGIGLPQDGMGTLEERLDPTLGRLRIISDRKSRVYINKKLVGTTPISSLALDAGVYDVKLVAYTSGRAKTVRARVDAGKVIQVELNFE